MGNDVDYRSAKMATNDPEVESHSLNDGVTGLISILESASSSDPEGIGFISLWSHGTPGRVFEKGHWNGKNRITLNDLSTIEASVNNGDINFAEGAIIFLGACNAGMNLGGTSFAQKLADITGAIVVAADGQVGPKNEKGNNLVYTTFYPKNNHFHWFTKGNSSKKVGSEVNTMSLLKRAKEQTRSIKPIKAKEAAPVSPNSYNNADRKSDQYYSDEFLKWWYKK